MHVAVQGTNVFVIYQVFVITSYSSVSLVLSIPFCDIFVVYVFFLLFRANKACCF